MIVQEGNGGGRTVLESPVQSSWQPGGDGAGPRRDGAIVISAPPRRSQRHPSDIPRARASGHGTQKPCFSHLRHASIASHRKMSTETCNCASGYIRSVRCEKNGEHGCTAPGRGRASRPLHGSSVPYVARHSGSEPNDDHSMSSKLRRRRLGVSVFSDLDIPVR